MNHASSDIRIVGKEHLPPLLAEISQPPSSLYVRGTLPDHELFFLCVVGSRKHTRYGRDATERLITGLAGYPIAIVSGLALGIDAIAHRAALQAGLTTIAVPGSGLDPSVLYPATNRGLAQQIVDNGGMLLSEFAPNYRAAKWTFPKRNRIMAGLSHAVLIVEAEERSGTLITARMATESNRDVCAVPGPITSACSAGPNALIKDGATPITSALDLIHILGIPEHKGQAPTLPQDISDEERAILEGLQGPTPKDELIALSGLPPHKAGALLSFMELRGFISENAGIIQKTL